VDPTFTVSYTTPDSGSWPRGRGGVGCGLDGQVERRTKAASPLGPFMTSAIAHLVTSANQLGRRTLVDRISRMDSLFGITILVIIFWPLLLYGWRPGSINTHRSGQSQVLAGSVQFKTFLPTTCRYCLPAGRFVATPTPPTPHRPAANVYSDCTRTTRADYDNDDTIDAILTTTFNSRGQPLRVESDTNHDGVIDRVEENDYSADGQSLRSLWNVNTSPAYEFEVEYSYCDSGAIMRRARKNVSDGLPAFLEEWTYRADGIMDREIVDGDVDGRADIERRYEYDVSGQRIGARVFIDGRLDLIYRYVISGSLLLGATTDPGPDNKISPREWVEYTYVADRLIREEARRRDDDAILNGIEYTYNSKGVLESETSYYERGVVEEFTWREYDSHGRLARILHGDRLMPSAVDVFEYVCSR